MLQKDLLKYIKYLHKSQIIAVNILLKYSNKVPTFFRSLHLDNTMTNLSPF